MIKETIYTKNKKKRNTYVSYHGDLVDAFYNFILRIIKKFKYSNL